MFPRVEDPPAKTLASGVTLSSSGTVGIPPVPCGDDCALPELSGGIAKTSASNALSPTQMSTYKI